MDKRDTNTQLLVDWIKEHGPDGISKLALASEVSASMIAKVRARLVVPTKPDTRRKLAKAIGTTENELFPIRSTKKRAS